MTRTRSDIGEQTELDGVIDRTVYLPFSEDHRLPYLKSRLSFLKWIGVILIAAVCSIPGLVVLSANNSLSYRPTAKGELNETVCKYIKQYSLDDSTYVTVCNTDGDVILDARRFLNGKATSTWITLDLRQWLKLKQITPLIDSAIFEARTYVRDVKTMTYTDKL